MRRAKRALGLVVALALILGALSVGSRPAVYAEGPSATPTPTPRGTGIGGGGQPGG